jgi:hydrogenase maturation protease
MPKTLVAGVGNIFLGDDAFGVEVVRKMNERAWPEGVEVRDFGIRGVDFAYALADGDYDLVILIDAAPRGKPPGTLFVLEPEIGARTNFLADAHDLDPAKALAWARYLNQTETKLLVLGCQPGENPGIGGDLSPPVAGAVEGAVRLVEEILAREESVCTSSP